MQCPYCNKELISGYIYGDRSPLMWMPEDKKPFLGLIANGEILENSKKGFFEFPNLKAYRCNDCKKMIVILE
ncbi:PF20097 family protein [Clostridium sp.]|uniref:PF20097 family protein n=1 Tax=Clostridium sp. TaxID=1506 RepID=UPI00359F7D07